MSQPESERWIIKIEHWGDIKRLAAQLHLVIMALAQEEDTFEIDNSVAIIPKLSIGIEVSGDSSNLSELNKYIANFIYL